MPAQIVGARLSVDRFLQDTPRIDAWVARFVSHNAWHVRGRIAPLHVNLKRAAWAGPLVQHDWILTFCALRRVFYLAVIEKPV